MDVQCGACGIEYEFDDALLSDRGTVVRCTGCGHQFRVFPTGNPGYAAERWIVFARRGERIEFASLRELQHALSAGYLTRRDELARGQGPRRPLGSIAELDGFFKDAPPQLPGDGTLVGIAPPPNLPLQLTAPPVPPYGSASPTASGGPTLRVPVGPHYEGRLLEHAPTRPPGAGLGMPPSSPRGFVLGEVLPVPLPGVPAPTSHPSPRTATARLSDSPPTGVAPSGSRSLSPSQESSRRIGGAPPRADPTMRSEHGDGAGSASGDEVSVSFVSPRESDRMVVDSRSLGRGRSGLGPAERHPDPGLRQGGDSPLALAGGTAEPPSPGHRWMWVAVAGLLPLLATSGVFAWRHVRQARAQRQVATIVEGSRESVVTVDSALLLVQQGRLDEASDAIARAKPGENGEKWHEAQALLAVGRAELAFYRSIWDADQALARGQAIIAIEGAQRTVARASKSAPRCQGVKAARVRLTWIRSRMGLTGEGADGTAQASPELTDPLARILTSHDRATTSPRDLAEQLGVVSQRELAFGPARVATVAAWLEAGDVKKAVAVLDGVGLHYRGELWHVAAAFISSRATGNEAGAVAIVPAVSGSREAGDNGRNANDRERLALASQAMQARRLDLAERHYGSVLESQPGNSDALTGLAQIARSRSENGAADDYFQQILRSNPGFVPALAGRADLLWDSGNRTEAVELYRLVLEKSGPGSTYGIRAQSRIESASQAAVASTPSAGAVAVVVDPDPQWAGSGSGSAAAEVPSPPPPGVRDPSSAESPEGTAPSRSKDGPPANEFDTANEGGS